MKWLKSLISRLKKVWKKKHSTQIKNTGLYDLYEDVKNCDYEDVHVLWSILHESHSPSVQLKNKK
ncbi:hypothetical protein MTR_5g006220 [Medicago truncatula]|uniref:Uncharacterized protein n=1 Tax=Medicago truncatula TaxID=3880 RepID=G7K2D8_MEDTR|nr:hypothetical protein MTR_5g006220 [Medicago truncatula]